MKKIILAFLLPIFSLLSSDVKAITTLDLGADSILVCNNSFTNIVAPMTYPQYLWSTGDTLFFTRVTKNGWVKCTVTDFTGSSSDSVYVQFGSANILEKDTIICAGKPFQLNAFPRFDCGPFGTPARHRINGQSLGPNFLYIGSYNGHHYYKITSAGTWLAAAQLAQSTGGYLATINDSSEMNFIKSSGALVNTNLWLGLYRPADNQSFRWSNCDNFNYTNWSTVAASPSTTSGENFVFMRGSSCTDGYKWENIVNNNLNNPDPCFQSIFGLVEFDEESNIGYTWSTGDTIPTITISPNTSQSIMLFVQQFGKTCTDVVNVNIWDLSNLISADSIKVCDADEISVNALSGLSSYSWSNGASSSSIQVNSSGNPGWYYVSAIAPGSCSGRDSVYVSIANAQIKNQDTTVCFGSSVTLRGPVAPLAYQNQYGQNFENLPFSGWNQQISFNFNSTNVLGPFYNDSLVYLATSLPKHDSVRVTFDLYIHDTWEGECSSGGKDKLKFYGGSKIQMDASFSNTPSCQQTYSNLGIPGLYPAENDASKNNLSRRCTNTSKTTRYSITKTFAHTSGKLDLSWVGGLNDLPGNQTICDESWSVDNIQIELRKASKLIWSNGDSAQNINVNPSLGNNTYWIKVPVGNDFCIDTVKVNAYTGQTPMEIFTEDTFYNCKKYSTTLNLPAGYNSYVWSTGATSQQAEIYNPGWHYGAVELALGTCFGVDSFYHDKAGFTFEVNDTNICPGASIELIPFRETYCNPFGAPAITNYSAGQSIIGYTYLGEFRGHHYYQSNVSSDWSSAAINALQNGGHLACINDVNEQNFIKNIIPQNSWLGLFRNTDGYHNWMNCDTLLYSNWDINEPLSSPRDNVFMFGNNCISSGKWKSFDDKDTNSVNACYNGIYGILEIEEQNFFYNWSTGESTSSINIQTAKDTSVSLSVRRYANTNLGECSAGSVNIRITNNSNLNINCLKGDTIQCITNNFFQFTDISSNPGETLFRRWDFGDGTISIDSIVSKTYSAPGTYKVTLILEKATGCGTSKDFTVEVLSNPIPIIVNETNPVCATTTGTYLALTSANEVHSWSVIGGNITSVSGINNEQLLVTWGSASSGTVILRDSNTITGCAANSIPLTVGIRALPKIGFTVNDSTQCFNGNSFTFTDTTRQITPVLQRIWTYSDLFQSTDSIASKSFNSAGIQTVKLDIQNTDGCVSSLTKNLYVLINNTPEINGPKTTCDNSFATYTVSGDTSVSRYTWTISGGTIISGQGTDSIRVSWGTLGKGLIQVKDSVKLTGCFATSTLDTVYINPYTPLSITGTNPVCKNVAGFYSVLYDENKIYTWSVTNGTIISGQGGSSIGVLWNNTGLGTLRVRDSLVTTGCNGISSVFEVTINGSPDPVLTGDQMVCSESITSYTTLVTAGHYYKWTVIGGEIISGQGTGNLSIKWDTTSAGPKNGSIILMDSTISTGCKQATTPYIVQINKTPNPIIVGRTSVCGLDEVNYTIEFNNSRVYKWEITGGTIVNGQGTAILTVRWNNTTSNGTLSVLDSVVSSACKAFSPVVNVAISPVIKPIISGPTNLCENEYGTYSITNKPGHTFKWAISGGSFFSNKGDTLVTIHWNGGSSSGAITVRDSNNTSACAINSDLLNINLNKINIPKITGNDTLCEGSTEVYSILPETNHFYTWNVSNGSILSGQNTANISVSWTTPGNGSIILLDSVSTTGCKANSAPIAIVISSKPSPVISGPATVCSNSSSVYFTTFVPRHNYKWTVVGGSILAGQGSNGLTVFWTGTGIGSVTLEEIDSIAGCSNTTVGYPVLKNLNTAPGISGPASACLNTEGLYITLSNADKVFIWEIIGGNILTGQGTNEVNILWDVKGKGSINLRDSSISTGCTSVSTLFEVDVINAPKSLIGGATLRCVGDTGFYGTIPNANRTYDWVITGGTIISGAGTEKITVIWTQEGDGYVTLTETVLNTSCSSTSFRKVSVIGTPSAYFTTRTIGGTVDFYAADSTQNYYWDFGDGQASFLKNTTHSYTANGTYNVVLYTSTNEGCKNDSSLILTINSVGLEDFGMMKNGLAAYPNPFSGKTNIVFKLQNSEEVDLEVYDMMGNLISKLISNEKLNAGEYEQEFNLENHHSSHGAYFVRLRIGEQYKTLRIISQ